VSSDVRTLDLVAPPFPRGVDTPCLYVDIDLLDRNIADMQAAMDARGVALRPHVKTHKSVAIARRQLAAGAAGLSVGTLGEAEVMADAGLMDLFVAYPIWADGPKSARLAALHARAQLIVGADSVEGARRLAAAVAGSRRPLRVAVEIDSGQHRTGVAAGAAADVAAAARDAGLEVTGVFTHGGHGYTSAADRAGAAADEVRLLGEAAAGLAGAGFDVSLISAGSSPTAVMSAVAPVTEERPGTYVFWDRQMVGLGAGEPDSVALVVLSTVVSTAVPGQVVLDAGAKTLTKDRPAWLEGFGALPAYPAATIERVYDYHAVVSVPAGTPTPTLGELVAIVPNHVCPVVNQFDELVVGRGGVELERWPVDARGHSG
jgi:D-serine deaminase-like pyridoxal phosphate-dependent protein